MVELEASRRTVLRDVEALSAAGIPVYAERGRLGGIRLDPQYRPEVIGLTDDEAFALTAVASTTIAGDLGLAGPTAAALRKIARASASQTELLGRRVIVDPSGWLPGRSATWLREILAAVAADAEVTFHYTSGSTGRTFHVRATAMGLVCAAGDWHMASRDEDGTLWFYRIDRMDDVTTGPPTLRDASFDLDAEWQCAKAHFAERFAPLRGELMIRESLFGQIRSLADVRSAERQPDGWLHTEVDFADVSHALEILPRMAGDVRVLGPAELVAAVQELGSQLLRSAGRAQATPDPSTCRYDHHFGQTCRN